MRVGQARKRDAVEPEIVKALEAVGATVTRISGRGAPDLLVNVRGRLFAFEVKSKAGKQTEAQRETQWPVIRTVEQALSAIGVV